MLYEKVEIEDSAPVQFLAVHVLCWDSNLMGEPTCGFIAIDPETTHEDLVHLKRIAQCAREELARAKVGSPVWQALRFVLSSPIEKAQEEPTWEPLEEPLDHDYIDCPGQSCGALD